MAPDEAEEALASRYCVEERMPDVVEREINDDTGDAVVP